MDRRGGDQPTRYAGHRAGYDYYTTVYGGRRYVIRRRSLVQDYPDGEERVHPALLRGPMMIGQASPAPHQRNLSSDDDDTRGVKRARVGASASDMQGLRVVTPGSDAECAVCLKDFVEGGGKVRAMPCAHAFHEECIFEWLRRKAVCPLCRYELPTQQQDDETAIRHHPLLNNMAAAALVAAAAAAAAAEDSSLV